jgi:hypothetical protein
VTGILDGLAADALRQPVLPTGWSCLGLVQHLALDVERFWFRVVMTGELSDPGTDESAPSAWDVDADIAPEVVFSLYRGEIERANKVIISTPLDSAPFAWPVEQCPPAACDHRDGMPRRTSRRRARLLDGHTWMTL